MMTGVTARTMPFILAGAMLALAGCAYNDATGYAPQGYPPGYDLGMGSGLVSQPGDRFGGQNVASIGVFTQALAPYGQWVKSKFGRAFRPDVPQDWRPYVNGQWGENRLWVSSDPWGWVTDHYGRWGFDERVGWAWVPGTEWAPSWVAWRDDPASNVTGWAPVPPGVNYSLSYGFGGGFGYDSYASWYGPSWVWVPQTYLYQPGFGGRVLPWSYGANYWGGSRWQYQPGFGGRPAWPSGGYHPQPGGDWQGRDGYAGGAPQQGQSQGGYAKGRPFQRNYGEQTYGQPGGGWQGQPGEGPGGSYAGYYERGGVGNGSAGIGDGNGGTRGGGGRRGISTTDDGTGEGYGGRSTNDMPRAPLDRPAMTHVDRPAEPQRQPQPQSAMPAMPEPLRPQYVEPQAPPERVERQEQQQQVQAQSAQRNNEGNTRPD